MKKGLLMVVVNRATGWPASVAGQVFRALGRELRVCVVEFARAARTPACPGAVDAFAGLLKIHSPDAGGNDKNSSGVSNGSTANAAWEYGKNAVQSGEFDMVVMDGIGDAMIRDSLNADEVVAFLHARPENVHVIVTGRVAPASMADAADMITDVHPIKESA